MKKRQNTSERITTPKPDRLAREIAEMAGAQRRLGIMDGAAYEKIIARHLGEKAPADRGAGVGQGNHAYLSSCNHPPPAVPTALDDESGPAGG